MSDLVERLRRLANHWSMDYDCDACLPTAKACYEAAEELERVQSSANNQTTNTDEALIRLAKAMDLEIYSRGGDTYPLRKMRNNLMQPFDPFTNGNDDFAVLGWMREQAKYWSDFKDELFAQDGTGKIWNYEIGDFARAALKVIDTEND